MTRKLTPLPYSELKDSGLSTEMRNNLSSKLLMIREVMLPGKWMRVDQIARALGVNPKDMPGLSAQIRDLRKPKYGGHIIESQRKDGVFRYRMLPGVSTGPDKRPEWKRACLEALAFAEALSEPAADYSGWDEARQQIKDLRKEVDSWQ